MTSADYLILTLGLSSLLLGMWRGMIYELLALMSWLLAFYVATRYPTALMYWMPIDSVLVRKLLSFVLLFLLVLV
ncbi:MAG: CvpA family protein, partial [Methylophilaceae bacterium]|nr:CvpA family protein [Methylophilaceae bacterium]